MESSWIEVDSLNEFLSAIGRCPRVSPAEEIALAKRIERGDTVARERMIEANLRLVVTIAKDFRNQGVPFLDLIQEGVLGLIRAVDKFDWRLGNRFSTYAGWWIQQSIRHAVRTSAGTIRVPIRIATRARMVEHVESRLVAELERKPTDEELAAAAGLTPAELDTAREAALSLGTVSLEDGERAIGDTVADDGSPDPAAFSDDEPAGAVAAAVAELPERARRVLELRYGLDGGGERSFEAIAQELGVSAQRVREIEYGAVTQLRRSRHIDELDGVAA
jgi:RNA polymerase primary sigma factor